MMGTNFYWHVEATLPTGERAPLDWDSPALHIGKRSGNGWWCWDCNVGVDRPSAWDRPLRTDQDFREHHAYMRTLGRGACPQCGTPKPSDPPETPAGQRPRGVDRSCAFTWAQEPEGVKARCRERPDDVLIENEYGETFTGQAFLDLLTSSVARESTDSIGQIFC